MYKVEVLNGGINNNVTLGARYCFRKKTVVDLALQFDRSEAKYEITKLTHIVSDIFGWSDSEPAVDDIYDMINERS